VTYATTDDVAAEAAARKAADDALDARLKKLEPAQPPITPPVVPPVTPPVMTTGAYGTGLMGDSRANLQVGWTNHARISYRFRSLGGQAASVRVQERGGTIYSGGNGGTIKCTLQTDANGSPSGTVLATTQWSPGNQGATNWEVWTLHTFGAPANLAVGGLYHLVFENVAADPVANYISLNGLFHYGNTPTPRTAAYSDDFAFMYASDKLAGWQVQVPYVPIFDLSYVDGKHDGQAYIGTLADKYGLISGASKMARERFTVSGGDRVVKAAHVRCRRISGTGALVMRLEKADGTVLQQATVAAAGIAVGVLPGPGTALQGDTWAHVAFPAPATLVNGQAYALRLSTDASTTYTVVPIQQGSVKGLQSRQFTDGDPQRTTDGGANWGNLDPNWPSDLQFWLD